MSDMTFSGWGGNARLALSAMVATPRLSHRRLLITAALFLCLGVGVMVMALGVPDQPGADGSAGPPPLAPARQPSAALAWIDIVKPAAILSLDAPQLSNLPTTYAASRARTGDARRDILTFGRFGAGFALRLMFERHDDDAPAAPPPPLFADLARQAAGAGLSIDKAGLPGLLPTRFGGFEVADIRASAPTATDPAALAPLSCAGFRLGVASPAFSILGLACGADADITRDRLACLLERLDLAGGEDKALVDFLAASELRRNLDCLGAKPLAHRAQEAAPPAKSARRKPHPAK